MKKHFLLMVMLFFVTFGFTQNNPIPGLKMIVQKPVYFEVSPSLHDMLSTPPTKGDHTWKDNIVKNFFNIKKKNYPAGIPNAFDPVVQDYMGLTITDTTIMNFEGITNPQGYYPPDTYGNVGPNHFFQVVNCSYQIWNKSGTSVYGPALNSSMWTGFTNNSNDGDAVVCYDEQADRWLFSQFSMPNYPSGPFYQMIAVSATGDPTGTWYKYQYSFTDMPDYPKFSVWPDGYYMGMNRFSSGSGNYVGTGAVAFNRTAMLAGNPTPTMVLFTLPSSNNAFTNIPADCDGTFPPTGTPEYFVYMNEGPCYLGIYEFHVDWTTTSNSTFGNYLQLTTTTFTTSGLNGVPQQGTTHKLDPINDRLMYRLQFRKFGSYWSMVTNHTVNANVSSSNNAGIRWYELRKSTGAWSIYQQSTYAPDNKYRWMGSIAMDTAGNMALGYSISSSSMYPSIRYCGRLKNDALNTMTIGEKGIVNGGGSQTVSGNPSRWGDYSGISVDPSAYATWWYTQEYYPTTSTTNWHTRIASFSFGTTWSVTATATPSTLNVGQQTQLNVTVNNGTPPYTYSWTSVPPGFTSNIQNPTANPTVSTKYVAHVTSGATTKTDTAYTTVILNVIASANPTTITVGQSSQLTSTPTGGTGIYTYQWTSNPTGFTSTAQNPSVSPIVNTIYTCLVTSGPQQNTDTALVKVGLSVLATATPPSILIGQSSQLDATPSGGSGTYTYLWTSIPPGYTSTLKNPSVSPTSTTQYIVNCSDGALSAGDTVTVTVTFAPLVVTATANPSSICAGLTSMLNVTATGGSTNYSYSWTSIPPGFTSNLQNPTVQPGVTTQYIATVNDGFTTMSDTVTVDVTPPPSVYAGKDTTYCIYVEQIPLVGTALSYSTVQWTTSGSGIFSDPTSLVSTYYPSSGDKTNGSVNLTLAANPITPCTNSVTSTRHILFDPCTGIPEPVADEFGIAIAPNPSDGFFLLTINGVKNQDMRISVTDMTGSSVVNLALRSEQNTFKRKFDLTQFVKGVYVIKVETNKGISTEKLIVR